MTRRPATSSAVRRTALAVSALLSGTVVAACGGSSPTVSSSFLKVSVKSATTAGFSGVTCARDPSGVVVTAEGHVANNGAGNLMLLLTVHSSQGSTVVLPGSDHSKTISTTAATFKVVAHLSRGAIPDACTISVVAS